MTRRTGPTGRGPRNGPPQERDPRTSTSFTVRIEDARRRRNLLLGLADTSPGPDDMDDPPVSDAKAPVLVDEQQPVAGPSALRWSDPATAPSGNDDPVPVPLVAPQRFVPAPQPSRRGRIGSALLLGVVASVGAFTIAITTLSVLPDSVTGTVARFDAPATVAPAPEAFRTSAPVVPVLATPVDPLELVSVPDAPAERHDLSRPEEPILEAALFPAPTGRPVFSPERVESVAALPAWDVAFSGQMGPFVSMVSPERFGVAVRPIPAAVPQSLPVFEPAIATDAIVYVHAPSARAPWEVSDVVAKLNGAGFSASPTRPVDFAISADQVRFYHAEDAKIADIVAASFGGQVRDFTGFTPKPDRGTLEVWLSGRALPPVAATRQAAVISPPPVETRIGQPSLMDRVFGNAVAVPTPKRIRRSDDDGDGRDRRQAASASTSQSASNAAPDASDDDSGGGSDAGASDGGEADDDAGSDDAGGGGTEDGGASADEGGSTDEGDSDSGDGDDGDDGDDDD